jgi:uncharacterized cupredoxin-like copper-binding protein
MLDSQKENTMKKILILIAGLLMITGNAFAAGSHTDGHGHDEKKKDTHGHDDTDDHHAGKMAVGEPGKRSKARKTIVIVMKETDDGDMIFTPKKIKVKEGQTIRFVIKNKGELEHEFVLDNHDGVMEHKALMEKFPEMEHDDPNSTRLEPGKNGEVIWKFTNGGSFEFACLIPGHYDAGMKGDIKVSSN